MARRWYERYDYSRDRVLTPYDEAYWEQVWWRYVAAPVYRVLVRAGLWVMRDGDCYAHGVWVFDATLNQLHRRSRYRG